MANADLSGKRAIVLGAETAAGRAMALALAEAGAHIAAVAASTDAEASLAAKRVARRLAGLGRRSMAQAIDASNDMAVRVMTRQVAKELGGLDLLFFCISPGERTAAAFALACRYGAREMARGGGGCIVAMGADVDPAPLAAEYGARGVRVNAVLYPASEEAPASALAEALLLASANLTGAVYRVEGS